MKVCDLLDQIFFGNGNPELLPILRQFAGDKTAEVFGIGVDSNNKMKMLIKRQLKEKGDSSKNFDVEVYLAASDGDKKSLGLYTESKFEEFYHQIMNNDDLYRLCISASLKDLSDIIYHYKIGMINDEGLSELSSFKSFHYVDGFIKGWEK